MPRGGTVAKKPTPAPAPANGASEVPVAAPSGQADEAVAQASADSVAARPSGAALNSAAPAPATALAPPSAPASAPGAFNQMARGLARAAPRLQAVIGTSAGDSAAAKQAGDSTARGGCYDVVAPVDGGLPRRIVLDTMSFGD